MYKMIGKIIYYFETNKFIIKKYLLLYLLKFYIKLINYLKIYVLYYINMELIILNFFYFWFLSKYLFYLLKYYPNIQN